MLEFAVICVDVLCMDQLILHHFRGFSVSSHRSEEDLGKTTVVILLIPSENEHETKREKKNLQSNRSKHKQRQLLGEKCSRGASLLQFWSGTCFHRNSSLLNHISRMISPAAAEAASHFSGWSEGRIQFAWPLFMTAVINRHVWQYINLCHHA